MGTIAATLKRNSGTFCTKEEVEEFIVCFFTMRSQLNREKADSELFETQKDRIIDFFKENCQSKNKEQLCSKFLSELNSKLHRNAPYTVFFKNYTNGLFEEDSELEKALKELLLWEKPKATLSIFKRVHACQQISLEKIQKATQKRNGDIKDARETLKKPFCSPFAFGGNPQKVKELSLTKTICSGSKDMSFFGDKYKS